MTNATLKKEDLRKAWLTAATVSAAIISAIIIYIAAVELVARLAQFKPVLTMPASAIAKYAFYISGIGSVFALKFIRAAIANKAAAMSPEAALKTLMTETILIAALCEAPAFFGLLIFFLTGGYWDFYLLAAFSLVIEVYNFPKYTAWENRISGTYGVVLE